MKNNPRAKEENTRVIQLDFNLPLYQPSLPSYFTQPPFFLEFVLYRSIKRSSGYFTFFFLFFFSPHPQPLSRREKGKRRSLGPRGVEARGQRELAWCTSEQSKKKRGRERDTVVLEMASLEFIRTRPEELGGGVKGGGMETIPRNFIGQPISGIIGNRWKSSFRRLCLLLASLD